MNALAVSSRTATRLLATRLLSTALAFSLPVGIARADDSLPDRLQTARALAGVDPQRSRAALAGLRDEAEKAGRLDWRLSIDEIDCRVLTDLDEGLAVSVAQAGLLRAGSSPTDSARLPWLRLRACLAGAQISGTDTAAGERELEAVLSESTDADLRPAHALALLERGVQHSRSGELLRGQQELLDACESLRSPGLERDLDLCLGHLANHYKRMGDFDEALRLLVRLRDEARSRGALWDDSIYTFGIAQVHYARAAWPEALKAFREALAGNELDHSGQIYAEHGVASTLLQMGRPEEGLPHIEQALNLLGAGEDPKQLLRSTTVRAQLLTALGRSAESVSELQRIEAEVRALNEDLLKGDWLRAQAEALAGLGHWREAYKALDEWRLIDTRVQEQRKSERAARLRTLFNRERDIADVDSLRQLNEQGQKLRQTQATALGLFVLLLLISSGYALRKLRQAHRLQVLASTDELTGVPNRRAVIAYVENMARQVARDGDHLSVLMIDVDHFKRVNDTHGHAIGDDVLRHLARVLQAGLRGRDRIGRLGGEEFVVVLPGAALDQAAQIAERMRDTVAATAMINNVGALRFTVSIGVAELRTSSDSAAALLARADASLYRAKDAGRNAVVLDGNIHAAHSWPNEFRVTGH